MTKEMEKKTLALCTNITEDVNSSLRDVIETKVDAIQRETRAMAQRQEEFDQRIGLVPQVMEIRGFMSIGQFCVTVSPVKSFVLKLSLPSY